MPLFRLALLGTLLMPLAACSSPSASDGQVHVRVDPDAVQVTRSGNSLSLRAPVEIVNASARTVYVAPCGTSTPLFHLQKLQGGAWENVLSPACLLVASGPVALRSGRSLQTEAWFHTYVDPSGAAGLVPTEVPGTYRVVTVIFRSGWRAGERSPEARMLPEAHRASGPFEIGDEAAAATGSAG